MWLLNTTTLILEDFQSDPPPYAILSHTWNKEEVLFQEIGSPECKGKLRYQKLKLCCVQAKADGLQYVWVDTCCIDKRSSAELSEAINSMFRWYSKAHLCYAYLADVELLTEEVCLESFGASRWFTRGFTLQELLAPMDLIFYDKHWSEIGSKASLLDEIARITQISPRALVSPRHWPDKCSRKNELGLRKEHHKS